MPLDAHRDLTLPLLQLTRFFVVFVLRNSPVAVLFQTIPNFIQPGPGAVVIQFSSRGATCANRSTRLIPELDHNSTAKEHDVRQSGEVQSGRRSPWLARSE